MCHTPSRLRKARSTLVSQMGNPECFNLFTPEELDIIQFDSLGEEMARSVEYDIVPDYDAAVELLNAAKRARG